jgi:hypothetical protein
LMVDPDSSQVKRVAGGGISTRVARTRIKEIQWAHAELDRAKRDRNVSFECRLHAEVPPFHGFLLNTQILFLTMSKVLQNGKYESSSSPYWMFVRDTDNPHTLQPIEAFQSWFDFSWNKRATKVR